MKGLHKRSTQMEPLDGDGPVSSPSGRQAMGLRLFRCLALSCFVATLLLAGTVSAGPSASQGPLSPTALVANADGKTIYVAEATGNDLAVLDASIGKVVRRISLPDSPSGLALSVDGNRLYVTVGVEHGALCIVDPSRGVLARISVGHSPNSPVVSADGRFGYVGERFDNAVAVVDLRRRKVVRTVHVPREPVAQALTPNGQTLVVGNLLPAGRADVDYVASEVTLVDLQTFKTTGVRLPNGSSSVRGVCVSPDGRFAYATHGVGRYMLPTTQVNRGWMNTSALSVVDLVSGRLVNTVLLDDIDLGAANPWGVACSPDGKWLCVAHSGTHEVSVIDRVGLHDRLDKVAKGMNLGGVSVNAADVPNDLAFLVGLRTRRQLRGLGPRGLIVAGGRAWVAEYFSDSVGRVDLGSSEADGVRSVALGPRLPMTVTRKGEFLFFDATACFQHWQSCGSCHPDARTDGLNWDLLNDGIGNPKQTKSMLFAHRMSPVMISGVRATAEVAVRAGLKFIQFEERPESDAKAIDVYLKSLKSVPSPLSVDGKLGAAAQRGKSLFARAGCASCHSGPLFTDMKLHDVGTGVGSEKGKAWVTPTLVEVWRTAPYLYDGRSATMMDVLTRDNPQDRHGRTAGLSKAQLSDLAAYVLSL